MEGVTRNAPGCIVPSHKCQRARAARGAAGRASTWVTECGSHNVAANFWGGGVPRGMCWEVLGRPPPVWALNLAGSQVGALYAIGPLRRGIPAKVHIHSSGVGDGGRERRGQGVGGQKLRWAHHLALVVAEE